MAKTGRVASVGYCAWKRQPLPHGRGSGRQGWSRDLDEARTSVRASVRPCEVFCHVLRGCLRSFAVALLYSCLVWLRGLSVLRFAGRSPLRDSSHTEEAGRRFFGGERSRGWSAERCAPCPSEGRGGRSGWPRTCVWGSDFAGSRLRGFAHGGEQRETVPGSCRAGPVDDLTDRSLSLYGACQVELEDRVFGVG